MPAEHYELSGSVSDSLNDAVQTSPLFDVYLPTDTTYYGLSTSSASQHLPEFIIDEVNAAVADALQESKMKAVINSLLNSDGSGESLTFSGKRGETAFSENTDGTYTHIVESGDTYWDVARTVVMAQTGVDNPGEVKNSDVAKMMNLLLKYNDKPTSGDGANRLSVGESITVPKDVSELLVARRDEKQNSENVQTLNLTPKEQKALATTAIGMKADNMERGPQDGVYNPLQPPGLEPGQTGDYESDGFWNYDVEERRIVSDIIDERTGMRTVSCKGQVDTGVGNQPVLWSDTAYDASETINKNGIIIHRGIQYHDSSVKMNFDDGNGNQIDAYVKSVQSDLDPKTGNYFTQIKTADGGKYYMWISGRTGEVIPD